MTGALRVGVLVSGRGSNLGALLAAAEGAAYQVVLVVSNVAGAPALDLAAAAGVPTVVIPHREHANRAAFEATVHASLEAAGVQLVVLAGFMRVLTAGFVGAWRGRVVNIHPSLLPAFPGLDAHGQALAAGVRLAGCTAHIVDEGTDTGPILAQRAVPVLWDDDVQRLSARILVEEHLLLPRVVNALAQGTLRVDGRKVMGDL